MHSTTTRVHRDQDIVQGKLSATRAAPENEILRLRAQNDKAFPCCRPGDTPLQARLTEMMRAGKMSVCPSVVPAWMVRTTSMPSVTWPNAAKPWPSGLRIPP